MRDQPATYIAIFCAMLLGGVASGIEPEKDFNSHEISQTTIATHLLSLGFVETPKESGIYQKKMKWGEIQAAFGFGELDLEPLPSGSGDDWTRRADIDGNHAILDVKNLKRASWDAPDPHPTSSTVVEVTVNLQYARPRVLKVGMTLDRFVAAVKLLRAGHAEIDAAKVLPPEFRKPGDRAIVSVLPDGVPVAAIWRVPNQKPTEKPSVIRISALFEGPVNGGFSSVLSGEVKPVQEISIVQYRTKIDGKTKESYLNSSRHSIPANTTASAEMIPTNRNSN